MRRSGMARIKHVRSARVLPVVARLSWGCQTHKWLANVLELSSCLTGQWRPRAAAPMSSHL